MRCALACAAVVGALLVPAARADAYVIVGHRWPGHTITYFNAVKSVAPAVALAVHAWNTSGAHVRFVAVARARAQVLIKKGVHVEAGAAPQVGDGYCTGYADFG